MRRDDWTPSKFSRLCSLHFEPCCYREGLDKKILHSYAVPTIFTNQPTIKEKIPVKRRIIMKTASTASTSAVDEFKENIKPIKRKVVEEECYPITSSAVASTSTTPFISLCADTSEVARLQYTTERLPGTRDVNSLKKQLAHYKTLAERRGRKLKNLQRKQQRTAKKIVNLETIIKDLKSKLEGEQLIMLQSSMSLDNKILSRYIMKSQGYSLSKEYPIEIKKFALTLQFLSPKAYEHVRNSFNTVLPHPKTLSRWYKSVDCQPGFTTESLETIKVRCKLAKKKLYASLSIDEMAIRKHVQWDGTKCHGYVDFGAAIDSPSDDSPLATEVLVFMVTCINEAWKIPVGYFLINGLSGSQKANLVTQSIRLLSDTGITVISLTFDGAPANASMAAHLGCNLTENEIVSNFRVGENEVAILYDPCHNIKLVRNALGEKKSFLDKDNKEISWVYLEKLQEVQSINSLHAANKISAAHIDYHTQKMKVKLATQLLSNSVADALISCRNLNIEGFSDCEPTVKFIKHFNDLFDILNSRNLASHGYKKPLLANNITEIRNRLLEIDAYIDGLRLLDGTPLIKSRKKTGFLGPDLSEFSEMVIVYIAGYVVRKLKKIILCEQCCKIFDNTASENHISANLIFTKNKGGLHIPSEDIITICKYSEKLFRHYLHILGLAELKYLVQILHFYFLPAHHGYGTIRRGENSRDLMPRRPTNRTIQKKRTDHASGDCTGPLIMYLQQSAEAESLF
ncbi:hypothetical protein HW555_004014 [Spodoptera exigua]|uniref:THAP-type domain-containing protein n=1 Tax=Spodoptera exigua TaxID=7107 RepID=A0A835L7Z3_SPOEX|nr:hypothetical protein HW555_004014 [Spodoptera exigua]